MQTDAPSLSNAVNRLWLPRLSLSACVRGVMGRDTRGVELSDVQRLNFFPASPLCTITWWLAGESFRIDADDPVGSRQALPSRTAFGGPHNQPSASWNPGAVHGMMLVLLPDALHHLFGLDVSRWVNQIVDIAEVLPPDWQAMCEAVHEAADDDGRVRLIEDFLEPRWRDARPSQAWSANRYSDWAQGLALRAATSGPGRSLRQVERRIKQWTGQPMRELRVAARGEQTFFDAVATLPRPNWSELAASGGYADQSHLIRETRRMTGFSPVELNRRILEDEGFWAYRVWG